MTGQSLRSFTDQLGRTIEVPFPPRRIVSLVPSQTELLADLGLDEEVAGITKFCVHPESWFRSKTRVGGTKQLNFERIAELKPDLIIGNKEENERGQIEELMENYPVWMSDIKTLSEACDMITQVGGLCGKAQEAEKIAEEIRKRFNDFRQHQIKNAGAKKRAAYFIWRKPYMCAGSDTFIDHLLRICGLENVFAAQPGRYPEVTPEDLRRAGPEIILLSSEPYPFKEKHVEEFRAICPQAKILTVDGELFSWYGTRLLHSPEYFSKLLEEIANGTTV